MKFKVGDKVRIVTTLHGSMPCGSIGIIKEVNPVYYFIARDAYHGLYFKETDIESFYPIRTPVQDEYDPR